jgi:SAM-dependent methyltransferase
MNAVLVRTEGFALAADVEIDDHRLVVMDQFSPPGERAAAGPLQKARLSADEFDPLSWEEMSAGNPERRKRLVHLTGWSYLGYGQVVQVNPMVVDFGIARLEIGPHTRDERWIGEFVKIKIDRLSLFSSDQDPQGTRGGQRWPAGVGSDRIGRRVATVAKAVLFHAEVAAWIVALVTGVAGNLRWAVAGAGVALGAHLAGRLWSHRSPVPMPYFMRWILLVPRGPHAASRLRRILQPRRGERILEIGPGVGIHALPIAASLQPDGVLDVLDIQQAMLDDLVRRAARRGLTNIVPRQGDAQRLPYPDATFDAAYLVSVLGEIPDAPLALRELRRVLKPAGRLLVGEVLIDPDFISLPALKEMARDAGLACERALGSRFAYSAVFRPMGSATGSPGRSADTPTAKDPGGPR